MSGKPSFDEVWVRIRKSAGETSCTKTGIRFTYGVEGDRLLLNRTSYSLSKRNQSLPQGSDGAPARLPRW